ncbi:MAG: chaperonin family protein RbcX, partial [Microcystis sp. M49629_WE12]|nr:chaperonin family protein RbcX [Microcystis sp. M49629_WE12]
MYPKKVVQDTAKVLQSYLTYQAVRTIIDQLSETNP